MCGLGAGDKKIVGKDPGNVKGSELKINEKQDCSPHLRSGAGKDGLVKKGRQR